MPTPAVPGETVGIVGGGQLGRMLALAGASLGLDIRIFDPDPDAPAARVAAHTVAAPYDDVDALQKFAEGIRFATCEFENVPAVSLAQIAGSGVALRPGAESFRIASDRVEEKRFLEATGIPVAPWHPVADAEAAQAAFHAVGGAAILKTRNLGYDGKGQIRVESGEEAVAAFAGLGGVPCVLERQLDFAAEFSVLAVRGADGASVFFDACRNRHADGILRRTEVPAGLSPAIEAGARDHARRLQERLGHVGVIAIEFFLLAGGGIVANEFAPRVHNSGHWTIDACRPDQFELHMRAVAGWPLPAPVRSADAEMINLIGAEAGAWRDWAARPDCRVHLYGKRAERSGRKMGHVTRLVPEPGAEDQRG